VACHSCRKATASRFSRPPYLLGPTALLAGVVEVEHRRHRVDPQAVDVDSSSQYSALATRKLRTSDGRSRRRRCPSPCARRGGVGCSYSGRPVEAGEREVVLGEVARDPVDDHADAGLVQPVDEVAEVVGSRTRRVGAK
jgi:hypothetical protein